MPDDPPIELSDPMELSSELSFPGHQWQEELAKILADEWIEQTPE